MHVKYHAIQGDLSMMTSMAGGDEDPDGDGYDDDVPDDDGLPAPQTSRAKPNLSLLSCTCSVHRRTSEARKP